MLMAYGASARSIRLLWRYGILEYLLPLQVCPWPFLSDMYCVVFELGWLLSIFLFGYGTGTISHRLKFPTTRSKNKSFLGKSWPLVNVLHKL